MLPPRNPIFCALDTDNAKAGAELVGKLSGAVGGIKVGKEFFTAHGPQGVREIMGDEGLPLFLDLKFHDISNTVAGAVRAAAHLAPYLMTVHASGGSEMLKAAAFAAAQGAADAGVVRPNILAVTVLTSLDKYDLATLGINDMPVDQVRRLAALAKANGADGVVCSPLEIEILRKDLGDDFLIVVPGVRPSNVTPDDQKRVLTPAEAMLAGASYVVIGRPITQASDPVAAARTIAKGLIE